jgi:hypothetical protein
MTRSGTPLRTPILLAAFSLALSNAWATEARQKIADNDAADGAEALKDSSQRRTVPRLGKPWNYAFAPGRCPDRLSSLIQYLLSGQWQNVSMRVTSTRSVPDSSQLVHSAA